MARQPTTKNVQVPIPGSYEEKMDAEARVLGPAGPITDWEKEPTVLDLQEDLRLAQPSHDFQVTQVDRWLAAREAAVKQPANARDRAAQKNRSQIQPKLVRRQAEWRYSSLSEPFLSADKLFKVEPATHMDVDAAKQNDRLLNWQTSTKINRVHFVDEYVRTAVDEGTVYVRPGWKRETKKEKVTETVWKFYPATSPQQVAAVEKAMEIMASDPEGFAELPEQVQVAAEYSAEAGIPAVAVPDGTKEVLEDKVTSNHPTLDILDYHNVYVDPTANGDIDKANFCIISFETSKAEMMADGRYKNLDHVNWASASPQTEPNHASSGDQSVGFKDELRKRVVAFEYWGFLDIDGTGSLTPIVCTWIGETMVRMEKNPYPDQKLPIVVVKFMPIRKSVNGEPDAELLEDNQQIIGALTRGMIDLLGRSANGQTGFAKGMLDVVNRRRYDSGQDYEFNPNIPPSAGVHAHAFPELPQSALVMLQLQNQEAEALTGKKAFSSGLDGGSLGDVATGIRGVLDAAAKREMGILRRLAEGMEQIGRKLIAMNAIFLSEEEVIRVTDEEFVTVTRDELQGEFNLIVDIATSEIDEAKAADLGFMLQTLGNTVPWEITQNILAEIADLKRMPALAHAIRQFKPQPNPLETKMQELEIAKLEAEVAELNAQAQLSQAKGIEAMARATELEAKARLAGSQADITDLDFVEQETGTKHVRDMDKQGAQGLANERLAITKEVAKAQNPGPVKN